MVNARIRRYFRHGRLSQLAVFEAAARLGCYTRAGHELHLAQPTVSAQIKKLSEALGVPLFEQVGKRMHLTHAGRSLQAACGEVLETFARLEESLIRLRTLESGRLAIAASTSGQRVASRLVADFARRHPALEVALHVENRHALLERMARDHDDLYLFAHPPREGVVSQRILARALFVIAAAGHRLAARRAVAFETIAREPLIARERGSGARHVVDQLYARHGLEARVRLELPSNDAVEEAVGAGAGVAILPQPAGRRDLVALDVAGFPIEGYWYLCYPVGKAPGPAAQAFLEFARRDAAAAG